MRKILTVLLLIFISVSPAMAEDKIKVTSVSGGDFEFDYQTEYLNINVVGLYPPPTDAPSWWDRLWGKKTSFGLMYIEYRKGDDEIKIPLFSYSAKSDDNYEFDTVGILESSIAYPIIKELPYSPSGDNNITLTDHYWEDPKKADLIRSIIGAANLLGGMDVSSVDKALNISTTVITLIEDLWPSNNQKNSITLSLIERNLKKNNVTFGYIRDDGDADPILTLGYGKRLGYFVGRSFSSALNEFHDEQLDVWRGSITEVDNNISSTGISPVVNQLNSFSSYLSTLPLNYADKVLLLANAIDSWAVNSVNGVVGANSQEYKLKMAHYRKLKNSDWELLDRLPNNLLENLEGATNCNTPHCKKLSSFVTQASAGFDVQNYVAPKASVNTSSNSQILARKDFVENVIFLNDVAWGNLSRVNGFDNRWVARYQKGALKIRVADISYFDNEIEIVILKVGEEYYIQSINII
ncbi:MAG: hypothetical protein O3B03_07100 [Proteobacteria bacterium]|nr:hypothetical protein [Pseudomonadota bacterium]